MKDRFEKQLKFLVEIDKMKTIFRRTLLIDKSRQENDAEHSWHIALMAMIFYEYADQSKVDLSRVIKMALIHDLIEVYAGDTFAFDVEGYESKNAREQAAADKLFALLPSDQGADIRQLWEEFDKMETADAQFAAAIDRLQPFIHNHFTDGHTWVTGNVTKEQVLSRIAIVKDVAPGLWDFVEHVINETLSKGYITE